MLRTHKARFHHKLYTPNTDTIIYSQELNGVYDYGSLCSFIKTYQSQGKKYRSSPGEEGVDRASLRGQAASV